MHSSITDWREDSYESLVCCICCSRKDTLSSSSFDPADRVILKSVCLAERGTYLVSCSIHCMIDFLAYRLQRAMMILWPKWRISGCRLVGSDATANSRASLAAFVGELWRGTWWGLLGLLFFFRFLCTYPFRACTCLVGRIGVHVVGITHTKHAPSRALQATLKRAGS